MRISMNVNDWVEIETAEKGEIRYVNLNRDFFNINGENIGNSQTIYKVRRCLIYSVSQFNKRTATVIPIKSESTDSDVCMYDTHELFLRCMIEENHNSLLCISGITNVPVDCIGGRCMGKFRKDKLAIVDSLVDVYYGRKELEDIPEDIMVNVRDNFIPNKHIQQESISDKHNEIQEYIEHTELQNVSSHMFRNFVNLYFTPTTDTRRRVKFNTIREVFGKAYPDYTVTDNTIIITLKNLHCRIKTLNDGAKTATNIRLKTDSEILESVFNKKGSDYYKHCAINFSTMSVNEFINTYKLTDVLYDKCNEYF